MYLLTKEYVAGHCPLVSADMKYIWPTEELTFKLHTRLHSLISNIYTIQSETKWHDFRFQLPTIHYKDEQLHTKF